ncbi:darcynin family protein [Nonomuraea sp. NPDC049158]|uniref:darcynin family protein n=1 Tax=Nonomuraea sp. NPDC049158 TaxID=3155649 RepID=UPI0033F69537
MPTDRTEPPVTAFMLVKTTPEWPAMTVAERVQTFTTQVVPVIEARARGVRSRFYDTEFSSARAARSVAATAAAWSGSAMTWPLWTRAKWVL